MNDQDFWSRLASFVSRGSLVVTGPRGAGLVLLFRDEEGRLLELAQENAMEIRRGRSTRTTLSRDIVVPGGIREMWLLIQVVPDGEGEPGGGLRIRYPVGPGR